MTASATIIPKLAEKPWRVLIVEDDAMVASTLGDALSRLNALVSTAPHGMAALRLLEDWRNQGRDLPDLMITDLRMPGMTGVELIATLREKNLAIPGIVAMSAEGGRDDLLALMRLGVTEFLEKPFSQKRLIEQMERARSRSDWRALSSSLSDENHRLRDRLRQWEAKESLGRVTQGILHDVHNCLAIITGSAEMIKMALEQGQTQGSKPVDRYADSITEITSRAVETLHQLQALNRMGEGVFTVFDLRRLISGTQELLHNALNSKVEVSLNLGHEALYVQGDAVTLQNAWIRLFFTLCDAMSAPKSGIHVGGALKPQMAIAMEAELATDAPKGRIPNSAPSAPRSQAAHLLDGEVILTLLAPGARLDAQAMAKQGEILLSQGARLTVVENEGSEGAHGEGRSGVALQLHWPAAALPSEWSTRLAQADFTVNQSMPLVEGTPDTRREGEIAIDKARAKALNMPSMA